MSWSASSGEVFNPLVVSNDSASQEKTDGDKQTKKRKPSATNIANRNTFQQQKSTHAPIPKELTIDKSEIFQEIAQRMAGDSCCKMRGEKGCIAGLFVDDSWEPRIDTLRDYIARCRLVTNFKNPEELNQFVQKMFSNASNGTSITKNGKEKFNHMNWRIPKNPDAEDGYIGEEGYAVCREGFCFAYGFSSKKLSAYSEKLKSSSSGQVATETIYTWSDAHIHDYTLAQSEEVFRKHLCGICDPEWAEASLTPYTDRQCDATVWMKRHFEDFGDIAPDKDLTNLSVLYKRQVYEQYCSEFKKCTCNPPTEIVNESRFYELWSVIYPRVRGRPCCDIPGKCIVCCEIDRLRRSTTDVHVQKMLKEAHHLHRGGMIMPERRSYKQRALIPISPEERRYPRTMSIIIDIMDQNHCKVPYKGTQGTFESPLKQIIVGVKEHGHGVTLFRTVDTVKKSPDLIIYVVLQMIEKWKRRNKRYPERIFLQCDGGGENANQYLLGMLELLVGKRVCKEIWYTRLPPGHTHEDIDAVFAKVWECFLGQQCATLKEYKERIENHLSKNNLPTTVVDVMIVPNFVAMFETEKCIDMRLSRLHKVWHAQLQWLFTAVEPDSFFPHGCKATFRAYDSDRVVEFVIKARDECISAMGQAIGMEPQVTYVRWFPSAKCDINEETNERGPRFGVEGIHLLVRIPHFESLTLPPKPFDDEAVASIRACLREVAATWTDPSADPVRAEWDAWASVYAPQTSSAEGYMQQLQTHNVGMTIPLKRVILDRNFVIVCTGWREDAKPHQEIDPDFQYPEILAASTNSVVTRFNPHPPDPRRYVPRQLELLDVLLEFQRVSSYHYDDTLPRGTNATTIKAMVKRKVTYCGQVMTYSGTKAELIRRLVEYDKQLVITVHSSLTPTADKLIDDHVNEPLPTEQRGEMTAVTIAGHEVKYKVLHQFRTAQSLQVEGMTALIALLRFWDEQVCSNHHDVNKDSQYYDVRRKSIFCDWDAATELLTQAASEALATKMTMGKDLSDIHRIYMPIRISGAEEDCQWRLLIINIYSKCMWYVDPTVKFDPDPQVAVPAEMIDAMVLYKDTFNEVLASVMGEEFGNEQWPCTQYPLQCCALHAENIFDSGIFVASAMYYLAHDVPLWFAPNKYEHFRRKFAYWILNSRLPK